MWGQHPLQTSTIRRTDWEAPSRCLLLEPRCAGYQKQLRWFYNRTMDYHDMRSQALDLKESRSRWHCGTRRTSPCYSRGSRTATHHRFRRGNPIRNIGHPPPPSPQYVLVLGIIILVPVLLDISAYTLNTLPRSGTCTRALARVQNAANTSTAGPGLDKPNQAWAPYPCSIILVWAACPLYPPLPTSMYTRTPTYRNTVCECYFDYSCES